MDNPFLKQGCLSTNASINKVFIEKMPTTKINQDIKGKIASEIFSTQLFIDEIKKNSKELNLNLSAIDEKMLPLYFEKCLDDEKECVRNKAHEIVKSFAERLAVILLVLKKGEKENRIKRPDWDDTNWEYWGKIRTVILVGGLASSNLGKALKYYVDGVLKGEKAYEIKLVENAAEIGIIGAVSYLPSDNNESYNLIFDFGQTFIKRSIVKRVGGKISQITKLQKIKADFVQWEYEDHLLEKAEANNLNKYIQKVIIQTIEEAKEKQIHISNHIVISIANYVQNGSFVNRGGYGKLRLISSNYEEYISKILSERLDEKIIIKFIHDGTSMASAFKNYPNSVCISLGTAFGIGFPNG